MNNRKLFAITIVGLTILTAVAVLLANLFPDIFGKDNESFRKWGTPAVLGEIIALFIFLVRTSSKPKRMMINLALPESIQHYYNSLTWDTNHCFLKTGSSKHNITLIKSKIGASYRIYMDDTLAKAIMDNEIIEFELLDTQGRIWNADISDVYEQTITLKVDFDNNLDVDYE